MDMKSLIAKMDQLEQVDEAKPDYLDLDKDGDKKEPMKKAAKEKDATKDKIEEGIMIQADGQEAMALLDMLKLAGQAAPQPVMSGGCGMTEEDDPIYSNTPDEQIADMDAATPSGNDMHREKEAWRAAAGADNPMVAAMEGKLSKMFESMTGTISEAKKQDINAVLDKHPEAKKLMSRIGKEKLGPEKVKLTKQLYAYYDKHNLTDYNPD